jgi:predicted acyltransferase
VFFFSAILFLNLNWKTLVGLCVFILAGYWLAMGYIPINGIESTYDRAPNNLANYVDLHVLGTHMYKEDYDPEGILSTLPSIASALLGIFTGLILMSEHRKKVSTLIAMGGAMLILGHLWDMVFPINKALWSSSFVLVTAGWANILLAVIYYLTDVKGKDLGGIFKATGANAITVYFLSSFITKLFYSIKVDGETAVHEWLYQHIYVHDFMPAKLSSLLYALTVVAFYILLAMAMYRRKIFIKV